MGLPVLPSGEVVRSLVRVPNSGYDRSLPSRLLDLSRSSSLAATVYVGVLPTALQSASASAASNNNSSNTTDKLAVPSPYKNPQLASGSEKVNIRAVSKRTPSNIASKKVSSSVVSNKTLSKTSSKIVSSSTPGNEAAAATGATAIQQRKRQRPNDMQEETTVNVNSSISKTPKNSKTSQLRGTQPGGPLLIQNRQCIVLSLQVHPGSNSQLQQQQQQIHFSTSEHTSALPAVFVQCGSQQPQQVPLNATIKTTSIQQHQEQVQPPTFEINIKSMPDAVQGGGQVLRVTIPQLMQETEELRRVNLQLKERVITFQNLFKDKQRLGAVVNRLYGQILVQ